MILEVRVRRLVAASICGLMLVAAARADTVLTPLLGEESPTTDQLDAAVQGVEDRTDLGEDTRAATVGQLQRTRALLEQKARDDASTDSFRRAITEAPAETDRVVAALNEPLPEFNSVESLGIESGAPLARLETSLAASNADRAAGETALDDLEAKILAETRRPEEARERLAELRLSSDELAAMLAADAPTGEPGIVTEARTLRLRAQLAANKSESARIEQELLSREARLDLLRARRDLAVRDYTLVARRAELLQAAVNSARETVAREAQRSASEAQLAAADQHPAVIEIAERNLELAGELPAIVRETQEAVARLRQTEADARQIEQDLLRSRQRLDIGGVSQAIGRLLVEERRDLPSVSRISSEARERRRKISHVGLERMRIEDQRLEMTDLNEQVEDVMLDVADTVGDDRRLELIRVEVRRLLVNRRQLLSDAAGAYSDHLGTLGDLEIAQQRLLRTTEEYREFLDRNLLWIPSTTTIGTGTFRSLDDALSWTLSADSWKEPVVILRGTLVEHIGVAIVVVILLAALLLSRRRLRSKMSSLHSRVDRLSTDGIGLTIGALAIAAIRALPLPLVLAVTGKALQSAALSNDFSAALASSLLVLSPFVFNVLALMILCEKDGIGRKHFGWDERKLEIVHRQLRRFAIVGIPIILFTSIAYESQLAAHRGSLGRIGFIVFMALVIIVIRPLTNPKGAVAAGLYAKNPDSWMSRSSRLIYLLEVGTPAALAQLAAAGYLYTAVTLTGYVIDTFWLLLGIALTKLIVLRWLALARRKIAWEMALEKRAARLAEKTADDAQAHDSEFPKIEPEPLDLDAVDEQTQRLVNAGLLFFGVLVGWTIWSDALPALRVLEDVSLWSYSASVGGVETIVPVTLADLLLALIILVVTAVASRNLPGLTEIAILQRLDLDSGSRYAINTLLRYVVITIGAISILSIIGWNWSRIQWLVAALSVGLGFGLQEIVGNFISGLIILFERPVRVGDTVTVGQLTGTVAKVQIRATTITDWDRKEIIVPNKAFITEQVVNWTLTDPITRIVVPVGISYGSDVELATRVMEDVLQATPLVLDEPPPRVFFTGFGDSSLDFKLFVYLKDLGDRLPLTHAVHQRVLAALREAGVSIPFPQRDLHIYDKKRDGD